MTMKLSKLGFVAILSLALVGTVAAEEEIDAYVVGQDVTGSLTVTAHDVNYDFYHEDFAVQYIYGQDAILKVDENTENLDGVETITDYDEVIEAGEWTPLGPNGEVSGGFPGEFTEDDQGVADFTHSADIDFSTYETGEYAFVAFVAAAESQYQTDDAENVEDWDQTDASWGVPSATGEGFLGEYDYSDEEATYGVAELDREEYLFVIDAAEPPEDVIGALQDFFGDVLLGSLVESISNLFQDANIGVPSIEEPPTGPA